MTSCPHQRTMSARAVPKLRWSSAIRTRIYILCSESIDRGAQCRDIERFWKHEMNVHALVGLADFGRKVRGQDHDFAVDVAFAEFFDQFNAAHVRHFLIDNDDVVMLQAGINAREGGITVFDSSYLVARTGENMAKGKRDRGFVVDCENA